MSKIHLIGGEKGGVGKSLVARLLAQYCIDQQMPFFGLDTDSSHGSLVRYYGAYASPITIGQFESLDTLVEKAVEFPTHRILVDLAAQTHAPLAKWLEESAVLETTAELGISLQYWQVMDAGKDSVDVLKRLLDQFGTRLQLVLVLNQIRGDDFGLLERSGEKARAISQMAKVVTIKRLHEGVMAKIDAASSSFWAATHAGKEVTGLGLLERQRAKIWLHHVYHQLGQLDV